METIFTKKSIKELTGDEMYEFTCLFQLVESFEISYTVLILALIVTMVIPLLVWWEDKKYQ